MNSRRLLYLDSHQLSAWLWQRGRLILEDTFTPGDADGQRFADYLRGHPRSQYALLANVAEEGHLQETIPYLQGSDRQSLIKRKLGQHFPGAPLTAAVSLGYEKTTRKNEKLLLAALTNPEHFEPWLARLRECEVPLAGIYSLPQLGGPLLDKLGHRHEHCLLLTVQDHSIRESYLANGRALFSRMAPLNDSSIAGVAGSFAAEAGKLHQYLVGQRLIGRNETMSVFILAHPLAAPAVRNACLDTANLQFEILDNHHCARLLGLHSLPQDSRCDLLFLHLLSIAPPRQQFADEGRRHDYRLAQIRQALFGLGAVCLLGSALFAAREMYGVYSLHQETQALAASERELDRRYQEISATFPQLGIDTETLRRVTGRYAELVRQQSGPGPAYRSLSEVLDQSPEVELSGLDWKRDGDTETLTVRGSLQSAPPTTDRQLLQAFAQFAAALQVDRGQNVKILQQPLDIESGRSLRGGDQEDLRPQSHQFAVQLTRKAAP